MLVPMAILAPASLVVVYWFFGFLTSSVASLAWGLVGFAIAFGAFLPVWQYAILEPKAIGLAPDSVSMRFLGRSVTVPWNSLAPQLLTYSSVGLRLQYRSLNSKYVGVVVLPRDLATALLRSPFSPKWIGPADVLRRWGIESSQSPSM
jgi:hypothetical protein